MKAILLFLILVFSFDVNAQTIDTAIIDNSVSPPLLRVKGVKTYQEVCTITFQTIDDTTKEVNMFFRCLGPNNILAYYDTVFAIPAQYPFAVVVNAYYDSCTNCSNCGVAPVTPLKLDSFYLGINHVTSNVLTRNRNTNVSLYPNPTAGEIHLKFGLLRLSEIKIDIVDMTGRVVNSTKSVMREAGTHSDTFNLKHLQTGVYYLKLKVNDETHVMQLTIAK